MFKIWRTPFLDYHSPLKTYYSRQTEILQLDEVSYSDEILKNIADNGFNGVWAHAMLQEIVKHPDFPEFGVYAEELQAKLQTLVTRAGKYGIKVYLQMQPPRAINGEITEFWNNHQDVAGAVEMLDWDDLKRPTPMVSLCTSTEKVRNYLRDSMRALAQAVPDLGGYIIISASEYPAHCRTRGCRPILKPCPRCSQRKAEDVVSEILNTLYQGMREGSATQELIAWNWAWADLCTEDAIVSRLDPGIITMADFERGGKFPMLGKSDHIIDEYALCYPGPSERFMASYEASRLNGGRQAVKFQLGTTHENGAVVCLPILPNIFTRANWYKKHNMAGYLGCWNFGNFMSVNTAAFNYFVTDAASDDADTAMRDFALQYFPNCDAEKTVQAWKIFAEAMKNFPHTMPFLYAAPTGWALGYTMQPGKFVKKIGYSHLPGAQGDDLTYSVTCCFTFDEIVSGITELCKLWSQGTKLFEEAMQSSDSDHARVELGNVIICEACYKSLLYMLKVYAIKRDKGSAEGEEFLQLSREELANVERALPWVAADARQGFHSEAHEYRFSEEILQKKIADLKAILA